jgi:anti-sigma-K factor RskA
MALTPTDHGEMHELVELYVLGALTPPERTRFESHLATCDECRASVRAMSAAADALAYVVPQVDPSASLRERVVTSATGMKAASAPAVRPTSRVITWLAVAASLVAAVGFGGYAAAMRGRVASLEESLREAARQAALSERQIADLRRMSADGQFQMAVLAAPDLQRMDLSGQSAAPRSAGRAFWSRSRGLVFTASNLPALPVGRTYQLWVLTSQPAPISAGLFKPDASGRVTTMVETPADIPQPVGMAVTIEPDGGVPLPTGDKFLVGP